MSALDDGEQAARMLTDRLGKNRRHLGRWAKREGITCWRHYDRDIPDVPVTIDEYEGALVVADCRRCGRDEVLPAAWLDSVLDAIAAATPGVEIFTRTRRRMSHHGADQQYQRHDDAGSWREVGEAGRRFHVNLSDYLDTGLFLDHRTTRGEVASVVRDRRVLNLFCYTGSFTVYAATAGAASSMSVDLSNTYLDWAADNLARNRVDSARHALERADVLAWLGAYRGPKFDVIVCDPPTFSNSKKMHGSLDLQRDHVGLLASITRIAAPGALLWFSTNNRQFRLDDRALPTWAPVERTAFTVPPDFGYSRPHRSWTFTAPGRREPG